MKGLFNRNPTPAPPLGSPESSPGLPVQELQEAIFDQETSFELFLNEHEPEIARLGGAWNMVRLSIDTTLDSNQEAFAHAVVQQRPGPRALQKSLGGTAAHFTAPTQRQVTRFFDKHSRLTVQDHAKRAVIGARLSALSTINDSSPTRRFEMPYKSGARSAHPTPNEIVMESEENLYHDLFGKFILIEETSGKLLDDTIDHLASDPHHMLDFIDWMMVMDSAQMDHYAPYLQLLAQDTFDEQSKQRLMGVIKNYEQAPNDFLKQAFWADVVDNPEAKDSNKEWLTYMYDMALHFNVSASDVSNYLMASQSSWPESLQASYRRFNGGFFQDVRSLLKTTLALHRRKLQRTPTINEYQFIDEKVRTAATPKKLPGGRGQPKKQTAAPSNTNDFIEVKQPVEKVEVVVGRLKSQGGTNYELQELDDSGVEELAKAYAERYPHEKKLLADVSSMVDSLKAQPFGKGTTYLKDLPRVVIDGQRIAIRRLSPHDRTDLIVNSEVANKTRVTYITYKDKQGRLNVGIEGIRSHEEYERMINIGHRR